MVHSVSYRRRALDYLSKDFIVDDAINHAWKLMYMGVEKPVVGVHRLVLKSESGNFPARVQSALSDVEAKVYTKDLFKRS